ncbi:unknown protein [Seminavis robusta]|uniref:Uncharacterized protein n=1 Tax=Seminavis robusta TaxID=568900 RepID=A0A9N8DIN8_9STRA|nr:unknown protein [Seminavis robusta]|eukprot:Sro148_g068050.1 n/a (175) ;mRNA; f:16652-17176
MFMSFSYLPEDGRYTIVYDQAKFDIRCVENPEQFCTSIKSLFYINQIMRPDLQAHRQGLGYLVECGGYEWGQGMVDLQAYVRLMSELHIAFPLPVHSVKHFNTSMLFNVLLPIVKRAIPAEMQENFEIGCTFAGGMRLDQFYMLPTPEAASERFRRQLKIAAKIRYDNERIFTL